MTAGSKSTRATRGLLRHPLYVGLFAALAVLAADFPVQAQQPTPAESAASQQYAIAAGQLGDALNQLAAQSHLQIVYAPELVQGKTVSAINGRLTWRQVLEKLLTGSGLEWSLVGHNLVAIRKAPESPHSTRGQRGAATQSQSPTPARTSTTLKPITVLGSLIPRSKIETASPLVIITAEQMKNQGFSSVADALQNLNLNTGSAFNNTSISNMGGSTWATKTLSLFGLPPNYVKYLVNGRPMAEYSQIVTGTGDGGATPTNTLITNLAGIPIDLVDHIEILSGGQSSLYGSDAIAGVVNIVLKNHINFATLDARYGVYTQGGGKQSQISFTNGHTYGKLDLTYGIQLNKQDPVYASQRDITAQTFTGNPDSSQQPFPVALTENFNTYQPFLPNGVTCNALSSLFAGSVKLYENSYCGSVRALSNSELITGSESAAANAHMAYHLTDRIDLYADLFDTYQKSEQGGAVQWSDFFYDTNLQAPVFALRIFAPTETSSDPNGTISGTQYENTLNATVGMKTKFDSGWSLDLNYLHSGDRVNYRQYALTSDSIATSYGSYFLGQPLGFDDAVGLYEYSPDYSRYFSPVTPGQYRGFIAGGNVVSNLRQDQFQAKVVQPSLFTLPGGDAGLAAIAETGHEDWSYLPSEGFLNGEFYNYALSTSTGHRNRNAAAAEVTLPILKQVTIDTSARYDSYNAEGHHFQHPTYSVGLEYRPADTVLLRAKYTTSFKAPELVQEFGATSASAMVQVVDYAGCYAAGISTTNCGVSLLPPNVPYVGETNQSNPALRAIQSKSFSYGVVWSPSSSLSASIDYQHLFITDQVGQQTADGLISQELYCLEGLYGLTPESPSCVAVSSQIERGSPQPGWPLGPITHITTLQYNIASSVNNSITANLHYLMDLRRYGKFSFDGAYTLMLDDRTQQLPGDPYVNEFSNPVEQGLLVSRVKANVSVNWALYPWSVTLFGTYIGRSPNYIAYSNGEYTSAGADSLPPWTLWNLSVNYSPIKPLTLSLRVNNLRDSMPPIDRTQPGYTSQPFNPAFYNPYGRQVFVEAKYTF